MNIWVGYDTREHWAFKVCDYSIRKHRPDAIVKPIEQRNTRLLGLYVDLWMRMHLLSFL